MKRLRNPYSNDVRTWRRGNLHVHTTNSDGLRPPQAVVDAYASLGYDYLMLSDHDWVTDTQRLDPRGMTLIDGAEITAAGVHILQVGARHLVAPLVNRQRVIDAINADGGFAVVNHPNWERDFAHCPQKRLEAWTGYAGIEIYNAVIRRLEGSPLATDRWDRLLGQGRRVWGFANDDSHWPQDDGQAWNMVQTESRAPSDILRCLREGRFYASTGVMIERIGVEDRTVRIETANAQRIVVVSDFGRRQGVFDHAFAEFTVEPDAEAQYVRIECWGPGESMAWTQPFYIEEAS